ncbi:hypothetical protein BDW74DRAFT_184089 [Aspergillus multicolor]|uniref:uncharacterized protein n=1 Tax=Aspergillus multicolor TaxID=41759 RepID=UPI003CCD14ED
MSENTKIEKTCSWHILVATVPLEDTRTEQEETAEAVFASTTRQHETKTLQTPQQRRRQKASVQLIHDIAYILQEHKVKESYVKCGYNHREAKWKVYVEYAMWAAPEEKRDAARLGVIQKLLTDAYLEHDLTKRLNGRRTSLHDEVHHYGIERIWRKSGNWKHMSHARSYLGEFLVVQVDEEWKMLG